MSKQGNNVLSNDALEELRQAKAQLTNTHWLVELVNLVGVPIDYLLNHKLPKKWSARIHRLTHAALEKSVRLAISTISTSQGSHSAHPHWHKAATAVSGGIGGFFGLAGLSIELPVTTTLMLRSIAAIAKSEGEPMDVSTRLACVEVLALGGRGKGDDAADAGYFATRAALAQELSSLAQKAGTHGMTEGFAKAIARFVNSVAARFSVQVSEKAIAQLVPVIGAAAGASLNLVFTSHFQKSARGHFVVRRLERIYGEKAVRSAYDSL